MASSKSSYAPLLLFLSFAFFLVICQSSPQDLKTYIVYTGNSMEDEASALPLYTSMLQQVADSNNDEPKSILYHYKRSFGGFVAKLTEEEAHRMAGLDGVVSVFPNRQNQLYTTRSWDFIGFTQQVQNKADTSNLIIGVLDSGIWPESESFNDRGYGPPPNRWKGRCHGTNFTCNNKIIGASFCRANTSFPIGDQERSARDGTGHGTHVASIAAGNAVRSASMLGLAQGTARGGAASARIAVYKVCWKDGCSDADVLAGFDNAIADGVDIITASIGRPHTKYFRNAVAIGSFHAMKKGVLTVAAAGNSGPELSTLINKAPWLISVAASTIDRKFITRVRLGNNKDYEGISINTFDLNAKFYPLIHGRDAPAAGINGSESRLCGPKTLNASLIKGKIVLCDGDSDGEGPLNAQAIGALTTGDTKRDKPNVRPLPLSYLSLEDGRQVELYMDTPPRNPTATIYKSKERKDTLAPSVASFSSRGPNYITPDILKPDLMAPGVAILAAWPPDLPPSRVNGDDRKLPFNIMSGTSMACPHVVGAASYIKTFHPTWSPAAIRSALMTTTKQVDPTINPDLEFGYGAGLIDPVKAVSPGLVYDTSEIDYVRFLCGQGYSAKELQIITGDNSTCPSGTKETARDLNYPSFALYVTPANANVRGSFNRTVTNVGTARATYTSTVSNPQGLNITVTPTTLTFTSVGQKLSFVLTVVGTLRQPSASGSLVWRSGNIQVRSPVIVFNNVVST